LVILIREFPEPVEKEKLKGKAENQRETIVLNTDSQGLIMVKFSQTLNRTVKRNS